MVNIAYTALQKALEKKKLEKKNPGKIAGFKPEQRLFMVWAKTWRVNMGDEVQNQQILTDPHASARFRTSGPVSNMPQFYKAFGCDQYDQMVHNEEEGIKVW